MSKFTKGDSVWFHVAGGKRYPGTVLEVDSVLQGLYEVGVKEYKVVAHEQQMSHRPPTERVGGLSAIRRHMEQESELAAAAMEDHLQRAAEASLADHMLTPYQLQMKYSPNDDRGWHPLHPAYRWRQEVAYCETRMGYWEWVSYKLQE